MADASKAMIALNLRGKSNAKLVVHELVEPRIKPVLATLRVFVDEIIAGRADKASATLSHYERAKLLLLEFFGADKAPADVTRRDADQFRSWMKSPSRMPRTRHEAI